MGMAWIFLIVAGLFEIGWPVGLKLAQTPGRGLVGTILAVACMAASGVLLYLAQREIPMGTAYAVWTGIGAALTVTFGMVTGSEPASVLRVLFLVMIVGGVVGLHAIH